MHSWTSRCIYNLRDSASKNIFSAAARFIFVLSSAGQLFYYHHIHTCDATVFFKMPHGSSVITDQRYYVAHRTETGKGRTHMAVEDCDHILQNVPTPGKRLRYNGRRPHLHGDREGHFAEERIQLDPRLRGETSQAAVVHVRALPQLAAYPARQFDYAHQNRRGNDPGGDPGFSRIVTDPRKNQLGLSYHPLDSRSDMVRAEMQGAFIADYRRDSLKEEAEKQRYTTTGSRSSTWPQR